MKSRALKHPGFAVAALLLAGTPACYHQEPGIDDATLKELLPPSDVALEAARSFKEDHAPEARIFFSQNSGEILWIDGGGAVLAPGAASTHAEALDTVVSFLEAHPDLFRLADADRELLVEDHVIDGITGFSTDGLTGLRILRFEQALNGIPMGGRYGIAFFSPSGSLLGLMARLEPSPPDESCDEEDICQRKDPLTGEPPPEPRGEAGFRRRYYQVSDGGFRLVDEFVFRESVGSVRILKDAFSGEVLDRREEELRTLGAAPSSPIPDGERVDADAPDPAGPGTVKIPSTLGADGLYLGFRLDSIHAPDALVGIGDVRYSDNRSRIQSEDVLFTSAGAWSAESDFPSEASLLARHLESTLRWFATRLNWASWNGAGAPLRVAVGGNRRSDGQPDLNAYAGRGSILVGDGVTPEGRAITDALEVVAHEFAHSVIIHTADFWMRGESGALHESLADFFGMSVAGYPAAGTVYGEGVHPSRDLLNPSAFGDPETYAGFLVTETDMGGVHHNSGIMNRALTLTALETGDSAALARFILRALIAVPYHEQNRLEEYSAATAAFCWALTESSAKDASDCASLESSFLETLLLADPL